MRECVYQLTYTTYIYSLVKLYMTVNKLFRKGRNNARNKSQKNNKTTKLQLQHEK